MYTLIGGGAVWLDLDARGASTQTGQSVGGGGEAGGERPRRLGTWAGHSRAGQRPSRYLPLSCAPLGCPRHRGGTGSLGQPPPAHPAELVIPTRAHPVAHHTRVFRRNFTPGKSSSGMAREMQQLPACAIKFLFLRSQWPPAGRVPARLPQQGFCSATFTSDFPQHRFGCSARAWHRAYMSLRASSSPSSRCTSCTAGAAVGASVTRGGSGCAGCSSAMKDCTAGQYCAAAVS